MCALYSKKSKRLTGLNPLAYLGVEPTTPPALLTVNKAPTANDYDGFDIGAIWIDRTTLNVWMLVKKDNQIATWSLFIGGTANLMALTGDLGGQVPPTAGNIDVLGGTHLVTNGNPGASSLTVNIDPTSEFMFTLTGDAGGVVPATAGNIDVLGGTHLVTNGNPGTSTITVNIDPASEFMFTLTGDAGGAVPATSGNIDVLGGVGLATAGNPGTSTITVNSAPIVSFLAYASVPGINVTGDATVVTIDFDTTVYDNGGVFGTTTFTAPSTGLYDLGAAILMTRNGSSLKDSGVLSIVTTARTYSGLAQTRIGTTFDDSESVFLSVLADMTAGHTATVTYRYGSGSGKDYGYYGGLPVSTYFYGRQVS